MKEGKEDGSGRVFHFVLTALVVGQSWPVIVLLKFSSVSGGSNPQLEGQFVVKVEQQKIYRLIKQNWFDANKCVCVLVCLLRQAEVVSNVDLETTKSLLKDEKKKRKVKNETTSETKHQLNYRQPKTDCVCDDVWHELKMF